MPGLQSFEEPEELPSLEHLRLGRMSQFDQHLEGTDRGSDLADVLLTFRVELQFEEQVGPKVHVENKHLKDLSF